MLKRLTNYFFQGLIFLAPLVITIYIFYKAFITIDSWLNLPVPGVGFLLAIAAVTGFGFLTSNFLTKRIFGWMDQVMTKLPFVRLLYSSLRDVLTAFVGDRKRFDKPVIVDLFPGTSVRAFGFMTRESLEQFNLSTEVAVYFPQSFNFAGNVLIYPRSQVHPLKTDSSKLMAFIVSGGITD